MITSALSRTRALLQPLWWAGAPLAVTSLAMLALLAACLVGAEEIQSDLPGSELQ
jgi:hypothetical protein